MRGSRDVGDIIERLYEAQKFTCKSDGRRFRTAAELDAHLDKVFAKNSARKEGGGVKERHWFAPSLYRCGVSAASVLGVAWQGHTAFARRHCSGAAMQALQRCSNSEAGTMGTPARGARGMRD